MEEKYIVCATILLLFLYMYCNNLKSHVNDNKIQYKYFDQIYYKKPNTNENINIQRYSLVNTPQESMNLVDKTLDHFKGNGKEKFNPQLSRESDSSIVEQYSNGSPIYDNFLHGTSSKKNNSSTDITDVDMKWNSYMEDYTDEALMSRADDIDSKYNNVVSHKGDSHFYTLNNKR
jgi:hypothetical protein